MCATCMDIVSTIHDETIAPEPTLSALVIESVRTAATLSNKPMPTNQELAVFLLILGSSLLVWESA